MLRIRWWSLAIFLVVLPALLVPAVWLIARARHDAPAWRRSSQRPCLRRGRRCPASGVARLPCPGLPPGGWRPVVFGPVVALAISVAVSHLGIEPEGMKQAMEVAREPLMLPASLLVMAALAPLVEETVFRGLLYGWLAGLLGHHAGMAHKLRCASRPPTSSSRTCSSCCRSACGWAGCGGAPIRCGPRWWRTWSTTASRSRRPPCSMPRGPGSV